jgi:hypothetical protein
VRAVVVRAAALARVVSVWASAVLARVVAESPQARVWGAVDVVD